MTPKYLYALESSAFRSPSAARTQTDRLSDGAGAGVEEAHKNRVERPGPCPRENVEPLSRLESLNCIACADECGFGHTGVPRRARIAERPAAEAPPSGCAFSLSDIRKRLLASPDPPAVRGRSRLLGCGLADSCFLPGSRLCRRLRPYLRLSGQGETLQRSPQSCVWPVSVFQLFRDRNSVNLFVDSVSK
jgi:hypothetical protein